MENFYLSFFLVHIIVTVSPLEVVKSDDLYGVSKRLTLRSSDPLTTRRSPELHFLRFGRRSESSPFDYRLPAQPAQNFAPVKPFQKHGVVLHKREADYDLENDVETSDEKSTGIVDVDCSTASRTDDDRIVCVNPTKMAENVSRHRPNDTPSESDTETVIRYYPIPVPATYDRSTRSVKFNGQAVTFNRFDRGHDNFMRLGRSSDRERRLGHSDKYGRNSRRMDNFMRLGRGNGGNVNHERDARRSDNFMRLGRAHADNFMRLGRTGKSVRDSAVSGTDHEFDRFARRADNFLRLGRQSEDDTFDWIAEKKRTSVDDDATSFRRSQKSNGFMRLGRRSNGKLCCGRYFSYMSPTQAKQLSNRLLSSTAPNSSRVSAMATWLECLKAPYENECDDDADEMSAEKIEMSPSLLLPPEKNDDGPSASRSSDDRNEEFSRATRRRGLYLRFGRSSNDEQRFPKQMTTDVRSYRTEDETK